MAETARSADEAEVDAGADAGAAAGAHGAEVSPEVRMANDIARQFAHLPPAEASAAIANHIHAFWDPRMRARLDHEVARDPDQLDPLVVDAVRGPAQ